MSSTHTIFALATAPGKSGIAIIRISGSQALSALEALAALPCPIPRHAYYVTLRSPETAAVMDRGLALYFDAPHSFTGENSVELQVHGSIAVIGELLKALASLEGFCPAEPGEFTRRAFINGKMDLIEAEGLYDLIHAETSQQKTQAMRQMEGELSSYYKSLNFQIIQCLALLEAYIDFPDEDIPESVLSSLRNNIISLQSDIQISLKDKHRGERLRDGINVVILGAPNVGKSSLINLIAGREAAIVSHRAGTTRDLIEIHMDIAGYPVVFVDTAGLRETADDIEGEGVRRALARAGTADIKLVLFDGETWPNADDTSIQLLDENALCIVNKSDLITQPAQNLIEKTLFISSKNGDGIIHLLQAIEKRVIDLFSGGFPPFITRNRHRALLSETHAHLEKSLQDEPLEILCEELRLATQAIGRITGKIQVDDVLDVIFRQFCIGK